MRPNSREVPRCGQCSSSSPTLPLWSRNTTRSSPRMRTRTGRSCNASDRTTGCQNRRRYSPPGVPGPTWVSSSSSGGTALCRYPLYGVVRKGALVDITHLLYTLVPTTLPDATLARHDSGNTLYSTRAWTDRKNPPCARLDAGGICRPLSYSPRHAPRLGAGALRPASTAPRLSPGNRARPRRRQPRLTSGATLSASFGHQALLRVSGSYAPGHVTRRASTSQAPLA